MPTLRMAHSPDPDDAFMFHALHEGLASEPGYEVAVIEADIETLNRRAAEKSLDLTALSMAALARHADSYLLSPYGASLGDGYGPVVVAMTPTSPDAIEGKRVATPGLLTTAHLVASMALPAFHAIEVPFDKVGDAVKRGDADAGIVIHEGQLTYAREGLASVLDLGAWWKREHGLPLPLGVNGVRADLPEKDRRVANRLVRYSIEHAYVHREQALAYAAKHARGLTDEEVERFVAMYVNDYSIDLGETGTAAIKALLEAGAERGAWPATVDVRLAED